MKGKFTFIDLFAGIGGTRIAFERIGGKCIFSSEWDKYAQDTYEANFGKRPKGDITKIPSSEIPDHDILLAGFPCQPFSIIGNGEGFADIRGTMFFEIERILRDKRPKAFLLENVKRLVSHDKHRTLKVILNRLEGLGYFVHWKVLNALDFGLPQKRERVIIIGFNKNYEFEFPKKKLPMTPLRDVLEDDSRVERKYFVSKKIAKKRLEKIGGKNSPKPAIWHENKSGNISILPHSCALRSGASYNYLLVNGIRRFTPKETLRLQGFPEDFEIVVSGAQLKKQTGNAVPTPMIEKVGQKMIEAIRKGKTTPNKKDIQLSLKEVSGNA